MTPEQKKVVERCSTMLKRSLKEFKRIVFDLAPDNQPDSIHYEVHGKIKLANEDDPCKIVDMTEEEI